MFTGIINNLGKIEDLQFNANKDLLIKISANNNIDRKLEIGCSIACCGVCLTLITKEIIGERITLFFQASNETLNKTTIKNWQIGKIVNLEFSLRMGDELGGHMVLGHIDGVAKIIAIEEKQDSKKISFQFNQELQKFIAKKGSVCLDGVSLTVNDVCNDVFDINLIEHSFKNTAFSELLVGDFVNLEIDSIARYLERLLPKKNLKNE